MVPSVFSDTSYQAPCLLFRHPHALFFELSAENACRDAIEYQSRGKGKDRAVVSLDPHVLFDKHAYRSSVGRFNLHQISDRALLDHVQNFAEINIFERVAI